MALEGPQPGAVAVHLEVPPVVDLPGAVEPVARREVVGIRRVLTGRQHHRDPVDCGGLAPQHLSAPVVEPRCLVVQPDGAGAFGDEGAVPEPAELVRREVGGGRPGATGVLVPAEQLAGPVGEE